MMYALYADVRACGWFVAQLPHCR